MSFEYSVRRQLVGDTDEAKDDTKTSAVSSDQAVGLPPLSATNDDGARDDDDRKDSDESSDTKTVQLSIETRPDGRSYMTKKWATRSVSIERPVTRVVLR